MRIIQNLLSLSIVCGLDCLQARDNRTGNQRNLQGETGNLFQTSLRTFVVCSLSNVTERLASPDFMTLCSRHRRKTTERLRRSYCLVTGGPASVQTVSVAGLFECCLQLILRWPFREERDTKLDVVSATVTAAASA